MRNDDENPQFISLLSQEDEEVQDSSNYPDQLPILALRNTVLFPGVVIPITVGREKSTKLITDAFKKDRIIGVVAQRSEKVDDPEINDIYEIGCVARILKTLRMPDGDTTIIIQGKMKFRIDEQVDNSKYIVARVTYLPEQAPEEDDLLKATTSALRDLSMQIVELTPNLPAEAAMHLHNLTNPLSLLHFLANHLNAPVVEKQAVLEAEDYFLRADMVLGHMNRQKQMLELKNQISNKVKNDLDQQQREYFLNQQIRTIQEELGQDGNSSEIEQLKARAAEKKWNEDVAKAFKKELSKLERTNPQSPEYSVVLNYLELLLDLPWNEYSKDKLDLKHAQRVLDNDHYGLEKIKDRILEYLAVLKLKGDMKSPILCLYGPPGVGKTSLGKSIAKAMGRQYTRMSLGGLHDEAEIRGHRKTYIGAMPGRIIQALKKAGSSNPVFILDEIDKLGSDQRSDPSSALLEVLDPEQNNAFYDNYLELEYDLSKVLFVATANSLDSIQPALRDRMEVIELNGYLMEEKVEIASKYLLPKQREQHGLKTSELKLNSKTINKIVEEYTRESGVRSLEKMIARIARHRAKQIVAKEPFKPEISVQELHDVLGVKRYELDAFRDANIAGVATGLAWTPVGGDVLYIETILSPGTGKITLTGKLGDVMKESALTALSYLKSHYKEFEIHPRAFDRWDLHIHVPEGAVPKDGPSAGITMLTALASAYTQRKIKPDLAMTGEITLRGRVLPVGGIKEKILAAKRYGIKDIIVCEANRKDVLDVKAKYVEGLTFHYVSTMQQVIELALLKERIADAVNVNEPEFAKEEKKEDSSRIVSIK